MSRSNHRPGTLVAERYELVRQLAEGGMGAVFEARDVVIDFDVAIKFLHPELASDGEMNRRFRREASILQSLNHPNIVRVIEVGLDDVGSYTVMELLRGETLAARLARRRLELAEFLPILGDVTAGLDVVHERGVFHGDLKPANIYLPGDGSVVAKLVDFGASKVLGLERLTRTGEAAGTPIYMAPELFTGEGGIDERLDIYALGILAYQCLSREVPFTERNPAKLLFQIATGDTVPLKNHRPDLPEAVFTVIARAMAPSQKDRFERAGQFFEELRDVIS